MTTQANKVFHVPEHPVNKRPLGNFAPELSKLGKSFKKPR